MSEALHTLARWRDEGWLRPLDLALARFVGELAQSPSPPPGNVPPDAGECVVMLAALTAHLEGRGHTCLPLDELARAPGRLLPWPQEGQHDWLAWANRTAPGDAGERLRTWTAALRRSAVVGDATSGGVATPLVLDGPRLFLRRYWRLEQSVARRLHERVARRFDVDEPRARGILDTLFPPTPDQGAVDWQKAACALALRAGLTVITGGPGTGKTYTVARLLALLGQLRPDGQAWRVTLAAPTGKAAARLRQSIDQAMDSLGPAMAVAAGPALTLHALLGVQPGTRRFRHHAGHPLELDVLVVDEASMVHLEMMASLLEAVPPAARLILLGDKDQLSSVEAGAVLGDLCRDAQDGAYDAEVAGYLERLTGQALPPSAGGRFQPTALPTPVPVPAPSPTPDAFADLPLQGDLFAEPPTPTAPAARTHGHPAPPGHRLADQTVMLRESRRFGGPIGRLALAVNAGDSGQALAALHEGAHDQPVQAVTPGSPADAVALAIDGRPGAPGYAQYLALLRQGPQAMGPQGAAPNGAPDERAWLHWIAEVLDAFDRCRLLVALREGPWGLASLNHAIEQALASRGLLRRQGPWYEGRPVMVTRNDPALGVFNGDVGVAFQWPWDAGRGGPVLKVFFKEGRTLRAVPASRLAEVDTAFAMTVHKSQGSEFAHTVLALPDDPGGHLTRELVYTGITRARQAFTLVAPGPQVLAAAIARPTRRHGGLAHALGGPPVCR